MLCGHWLSVKGWQLPFSTFVLLAGSCHNQQTSLLSNWNFTYLYSLRDHVSHPGSNRLRFVVRISVSFRCYQQISLYNSRTRANFSICLKFATFYPPSTLWLGKSSTLNQTNGIRSVSIVGVISTWEVVVSDMRFLKNKSQRIIMDQSIILARLVFGIFTCQFREIVVMTLWLGKENLGKRKNSNSVEHQGYPISDSPTLN